MSASTTERLTPQQDFKPIPDFIVVPVAASTKIYQGVMVALALTGAALGNALGAANAAGSQIVLGRAEGPGDTGLEGTVDNTLGANGALSVRVKSGVFKWANGTGADVIAQSNVGSPCYASDDHTVNLTDGGGTRPFAGIIQQVDSDGVWVQQGLFITGAPASIPAEVLGPAVAALFKARAVVTSLQAYTGSGTNVLTETANGAWATQDGVTNVVGDIVFIPATTTNLTGALDSGPWQITSLGSAGTKWVLTRPDWFTTGSTVQIGLDVVIGGEGTAWAGNTWRSFAAVSQVVGTNDPVFYPKFQTATTGSMVAGVAPAVTTLFVRPLAQYSPIPAVPAGAQGILRMTTTTAGYPGTSSLVVTSSSGTDTGTVKIQLVNF